MSLISSTKTLFWASMAANTVSASPVEKRGTIASSTIVGFPQTVPSGTLGQLYLNYHPYLDVVNGCVPFPAVNAAGQTK